MISKGIFVMGIKIHHRMVNLYHLSVNAHTNSMARYACVDILDDAKTYLQSDVLHLGCTRVSSRHVLCTCLRLISFKLQFANHNMLDLLITCLTDWYSVLFQSYRDSKCTHPRFPGVPLPQYFTQCTFQLFSNRAIIKTIIGDDTGVNPVKIINPKREICPDKH